MVKWLFRRKKLKKIKQRNKYKHLSIEQRKVITCICGHMHPLVAEFGYCGTCATIIYGKAGE
jgi:hypothetical protein